jgi:hypothetical protein
MLAGWESFYQVTGEGAATLTGLLFLAATLTGGRDPERLSQGLRVFSTPTVVKFVTVILASALALIPRPDDGWGTAGLVALGVFGIVYGLKNCWSLHRFGNATHWSDPWFYGYAPPVAYAALTLAAVATVHRTAIGPSAVAGSVLLILVLAIRNAWDLVSWLAPRRDQL